ATPDPTHAELALRAVKAGKHVLCEIPMAYNYQEVVELVRAVEGEGVVYLLRQQVRHWPVFRRVKELVKSSFFGEVFYAEAEYLHNIEGLIQETPWRRAQTTMLGGGPHVVDVLQWLIGELVEVFARSLRTISGQVADDFTAALYRSAEGAVGLALVSYGVNRPYSLSIRPYRTRASFEQDRAPWSCTYGLLMKVSGYERLALEEVKAPVASHGGADYLQALNFVRAIEGLERPAMDVREVARVTCACIAALESSVRGVPVRIPEVA
ncbi:MAG: hypothetical protein DRJ56_08105, partial [Thermoprotei archaeon]